MCRLVSRAGGRIRLPKGCEGLEVSPTISYSGEGLRTLCRGRTFRQAHDVFLQVCCHALACFITCHLLLGMSGQMHWGLWGTAVHDLGDT